MERTDEVIPCFAAEISASPGSRPLWVGSFQGCHYRITDSIPAHKKIGRRSLRSNARNPTGYLNEANLKLKPADELNPARRVSSS